MIGRLISNGACSDRKRRRYIVVGIEQDGLVSRKRQGICRSERTERVVVWKRRESPNGQLSPEDDGALLVGPKQKKLLFGEGGAPWCLERDNDAVFDLD